MIYEGLEELISIAYRCLRRIPEADTTFLDSVSRQFRENGRLSEKQILALENIAKRELDKRKEMENNLTLW